MVFGWGESAPIWGRYGDLNFGIFWLFGELWPTFARNSVDRFSIFDGVRQPHVLSNDAENFRKIYFVEFEQFALEVGNIAVSTWNILAFAGGLNNGVMVTPPGGSSVTVRDRPPNVLGVE